MKLGGSLLNTKEAARVLRVSEASIRRWSDSGLLPARRIGPRRERRFELSQLEQFLGNIPDNRLAELHSSPAVTIGGASVPFRSHFAPIYSTDAGGLRLTVPFLADGLRAGQACFLAASGAVLDRYSKALRDDQAIDLGKAIESGRLVVMPGPGATVEESIANWEEKFARALATGGTSIRVVGEMACERRLFASDAAMLAYEEAYDLMTRRFPVVTLCPYDAREFGGETILRVLKAHPDTFQQHLGLFLS